MMRLRSTWLWVPQWIRDVSRNFCGACIFVALKFSGPEVLFKTCVAMKFVDDDDDDDDALKSDIVDVQP